MDSKQRDRRLQGLLQYIEARVVREERGKIIVSWKDSSIIWEDTTYGTADIFDSGGENKYNKNDNLT